MSADPPVAPPEFDGRCGKWMPNAKTWCALPLRHSYSKCRTTAGWKAATQSTAKSNRARAAKRRKLIDEYKLRRGCEMCGYAEHPVALDLDHKDASTKVEDVSRLLRYASWKRVLEELDKCRVLCSNCHRIKTHEDEDYLAPGRRKAGPPSAHSS